MIISLSGAHGSGKSTVAQKLAEALNWPRYYMGGMRREAAKKQGMTLAEYNQLGENNPETDRIVDEYQQELGRTQDNFVIEGRTSWYFIPHSLKIYLDVSPQVGAERIYGHLQEKNDRNEDKELDSPEAVLTSMEKRAASDAKRYSQYYNFDINDKKHYDLYLDTTKMNKDQVFAAVYQFVQEKINQLDKRD